MHKNCSKSKLLRKSTIIIVTKVNPQAVTLEIAESFGKVRLESQVAG